MRHSLLTKSVLFIAFTATWPVVSLAQETTAEQLQRLGAEIQMLRRSVRTHLGRNKALQKDNAKLKEQIERLLKTCEEHGIETTGPKTEGPRGLNEKAERHLGLDGPLTEEQQAVIKQLKAAVQRHRAIWKRTKYKQCLSMMAAQATVAKTLAEYGHAKECLRSLRGLVGLGSKSSKAIGYYHWTITSALSRGCRESANALFDRWRAFDSAMSSLRIGAPLLRTDLPRLHEVADTCRSIGLKARKRADKLAALNAAVEIVLLATPLKTATARDIELPAKLCDDVAAETEERNHKAAALKFYRLAVEKDAKQKNAWVRIRALEGQLKSDE